MTNHARTLLLNRAAAGRPAPGTLGEEYVPAEFIPLEHPKEIAELHAHLFGKNPDDLALNYRLAQYMQVLHASPAARQYVLDLDPRISYRSDNTLALTQITLSVTKADGQDWELSLQGAFTGDEAAGGCRRLLTVSFDSDSCIVLESARNTRTDTPLDIAAVSAAQSSDNLDLADTGLQFRVYNPLNTDTLEGSSFQVDLLARPSRTLPQILTEILSHSAALDVLSRGDGDYVAFRRMIEEGISTPEKLAGILLVLVWRIQEVWRERA